MTEEETIEGMLAEEEALEAETGGGDEEADVQVGPEDGDEVAEDGDGIDDEGELTDEDEDADFDAEDEDEDEGEEPEGEPEPESTPSGKEDRLEHDLRVVRQELAQLKQQLQQPKQAQPAQPAPPARDPNLQAAVTVALFGGADARERLDRFDPSVRAEALKAAKEFNEDTSLQAVDFEAFYHKRIGPLVDQHIAYKTQRFTDESRRSRQDKALGKHKGYLDQPGVEEQVLAIMKTIPGPMVKALDLAVELNKSRRGTVARTKKSQRDKARDRDLSANKKAKRSRGRQRRRSSGRPVAKKHEMHDVLGDAEFLSGLSEAELDKLG